jgi:hypothetical protein
LILLKAALVMAFREIWALTKRVVLAENGSIQPKAAPVLAFRLFMATAPQLP